MPRTGGQVIVETLEDLGITDVFGIPGQHALALFDALEGSSLRYTSARVENNAAFAADGYARATGRPAALFLSTGPGALTSLAGLQEAYASGVPVLVVCAQIPAAGLGGARKGFLHQLVSQASAAAQVTKAQYTVRHGSALPQVLADAHHAALSAPQGPVWVEVPQDVLLAETLTEQHIDPREPDAAAPGCAEQAAGLLARAEKPVILAGGGVARSAGADSALRAVAERLGAPVACTGAAVGALPLDHPLSVGSWVEDRAVTDLLAEADVLLALGTSMGEVTSNYFSLRPRGTVIQVDANPAVLGSNHDVLGVCADAGEFLRRLGAGLPAGLSARAGEERAARVREAILRRLDGQDLAHERAFMAALRRAIPSGAATYWDMTIAAYWAWNLWDPREGLSATAQGAGGLGYGFPAAIGGAVARGERTYAIAGDGSAMYSLAELAVAVQHKLPVTWIIIDDGGYGILREYMNDTFGRAVGTELARPDFLRVAEAFGVPATRCRIEDAAAPGAAEELVEAIATASEGTGPRVVVCETSLRMFAPS
ncbi:thiamine pyrophosphate-binding protein [Corynebacterium uropygiale]|uniref:acetolactate synthase n=1 Tax=Corynebacterium uropygiale TaxID=1775911 RepID=A0A9X1QRY2_9CORY|nr:thiamine pyrophosphate-binding protein [Corynebacterium uropygiale]MCF4007292.1 thiamine pyrophosphate-binding protein [Corynebacterium uropygiale]